MKGFLSLALGLSVLLVAGCATSRKEALKKDFARVHYQFQMGEYTDCVESINKMNRSYSLDRGSWASLMFYRANCLEEMGLPAGAHEGYREIAKTVPDTGFAVRAKKRLAAQEGDQREHVQIDFDKELWGRVKKSWNEKMVATEFCPLTERANPATSHRMVILTSSDFREETRTPRSVMDRVQAEAQLHGGPVTVTQLEQNEHDGIWQMYRPKSGKSQMELSSVVRVVFTANRFHVLIFTRRNGELAPMERELWVSRLKKARLVVTAPAAAKERE